MPLATNFPAPPIIVALSQLRYNEMHASNTSFAHKRSNAWCLVPCSLGRPHVVAFPVLSAALGLKQKFIRWEFLATPAGQN